MRPPVRKARPSFGIRYSASATVGRSPGRSRPDGSAYSTTGSQRCESKERLSDTCRTASLSIPAAPVRDFRRAGKSLSSKTAGHPLPVYRSEPKQRDIELFGRRRRLQNHRSETRYRPFVRPCRHAVSISSPDRPSRRETTTAPQSGNPNRLDRPGAKPNIGSASVNRETGEKRLRQADLARRLPGREADERNSGVLPPPERSLLRKHRAVRRIGRFGSAACCRRNFPRAHRIDCPRFSLSLRAAARINTIRPVRTHRGRFSFAPFLLIGPRII